MEPRKQQLEMVRYGNQPMTVPPVAPGYSIRQYEERDRASYWMLFREVFEKESRLDRLHTASLPGGFHVIVEDATQDVVATAAAAEFERDGHEEPGSLQWVMTDPLHLGRGLGRVVIAAATATLVDAGYKRVYLSTDDPRLPAIYLYLELGWKPLLHAADMKERWLNVYRQLNREPGPDEFVEVS